MLVEGKNVWRLVNAGRVACLVDGEAYYSAVASAMMAAHHSIFFLGWDIHSGIRLLRNGQSDRWPQAIGPRLSALLSERPDLHVYVLDWAFPFIFANEREPKAKLYTDWPDHDHFHFIFDDVHPPGASHHQKIVLIDDSVAFIGGMDIARSRWDTSQHLKDDPRRCDRGSPNYPSTHDVQAAVDGEAARVLGELVRYRWTRAGGANVAWTPARDIWPSAVRPDLTNVTVGFSRTIPSDGSRPGIEEVKHLHLDAIAAARELIYIENQYLTSSAIVEALAKRLAGSDAPEVIAVLPFNNYGWLERHTIEVMRFKSIQRLRESDRHGRLRICYPVVARAEDKVLNVHAKVLVIDNVLLRIGSSNLTNRSMSLDTECDLAIEAEEASGVSRVISDFRNRLVAEHLSLAPEEVASRFAAEKSLIHVIDSFMGRERCLENLQVPPTLEAMLIDSSLIDPAKPLTSEVLIERFAPAEVRHTARRQLAYLIAVLIILTSVSAAWRWTGFQRWIDFDSLASLAPGIRQLPFPMLSVTVIYLVASLLMIPVTALIVATVLAFGGWRGGVYAIVGCLFSAAAAYWIGQRAGRKIVRRFSGPRLHRLVEQLESRGLLTMITLRLLPVAPFTVVNMAIGASGMRFRDFALGTVVGMIPGVAAISLFNSGIHRALENPGTQSFAFLVSISAVTIGFFLWLRRRLGTVRS